MKLRGHLRIARVDHWVKNVFVLPGAAVALSIEPRRFALLDPGTVLAGLAAVCLIASSNYVLNELLDAPFDAVHPVKRLRAVPSGQVSIPLAWIQWLALMAAGVLLGWRVSPRFAAVVAVLWIMGCAYNVPPLRTKDLPYIDVLSEAVNNPLRLLAGWYLTGTAAVPITSLLLSYWMAGCYFMAIKRYAEYRHLRDHLRAAYRKPFAHYTDRRLLVSIMFYASHAMLFFGAFIARYRLELILAFPLVALVMAIYLSLAFKPDSAVERPETLYREPKLVVSVALCSAVMLLLLYVDVQWLHRVFAPTVVSR